MSVLDQLLSKGYFPKELPPAFTTDVFTQVVTQATFNPDTCLVAPTSKGKLVHAENGISRLGKHNLARLDGTSRPLHIPHPSHYFYLSQQLSNKWTEVETHLRKSLLALSTPKSDPNAVRAYISSESGAARPNRRLNDRSQGNALLVADIANFYGTLYTHTIPWALHTKNVAKANRTDLNLLGNALDLYIRNGQDSQTSGIPIGTDTSFIIAEIVLSSIDSQLQMKYPSLVGFRFYDDYELVCEDELMAQQILAELQALVAEYELTLNQRKIKIIRLPSEVDHPWLTELRQFKLTSGVGLVSPNAQREQFIDFANLVFSLFKRYPNDPILRYGLVKTSTQAQPKEFWDVYQNFLLQVFRSEPQLSHLVAGELLKYKQQGKQIDKMLLQMALQSHIARYALSGATNEVAWALWMAVLFEVRLSDQVIEKITNIPDNIVAILLLHAQEKGLTAPKIDTSLWQSNLTEANIYSENWLLAYEAASKGWLAIADGSNYIANHPCFGGLRAKNVSFYDENSYSDTPTILKRLEVNADLYTT